MASFYPPRQQSIVTMTLRRSNCDNVSDLFPIEKLTNVSTSLSAFAVHVSHTRPAHQEMIVVACPQYPRPGHCHCHHVIIVSFVPGAWRISEDRSQMMTRGAHNKLKLKPKSDEKDRLTLTILRQHI